jgi:hypothetical protein
MAALLGIILVALVAILYICLIMRRSIGVVGIEVI